jgi:hypothetical protein
MFDIWLLIRRMNGIVIYTGEDFFQTPTQEWLDLTMNIEMFDFWFLTKSFTEMIIDACEDPTDSLIFHSLQKRWPKRPADKSMMLISRSISPCPEYWKKVFSFTKKMKLKNISISSMSRVLHKIIFIYRKNETT